MSSYLHVTQVVGTSTRQETLDGRVYLVARVVPIREAVLNEYFVPAEEIAAFVDAWNGIPLPIGHPRNAYGEYISAQSPALLSQSIGQFFHARMDGTRLIGEVWLDMEKCHRLGGDAVECVRRILVGEPLEVSTAFFPETDMVSGTYQGQPYQGIHRHLRPDHLALLPDSVGACSVAMGCGVRTHQSSCPCQGKGEPMPLVQSRAVARRPTFTGTETAPWSRPTFAEFVHALFPGPDAPATVAVCTATQKQQIAAHTLLGDETADTFDQLVVFPVVNARTRKLNERALRAVISGRGSQAAISTTALDSAQAMARTLLNSEFAANLAPQAAHEKQGRFKTAIDAILAFAWGTGTDVPEDMPALLPPRVHVTQDDIALSLSALLSAGSETPYLWSDCMIVDIEASYVIYREQGVLMRQAYMVDPASGAVTLTGTPEEVQRNTQYVPVAAGTTVQSQEAAVPVAVLVQHEGDAMDETPQLVGVTAEVQTGPPITLEAIHMLLTTELDRRDQVLESRLQAYTTRQAEQQERAHLTAYLSTHAWTQEECDGTPLVVLRKMVQSLGPATFAGLGLPALASVQAYEDNLPDDAPKW